MLLACRAYGTLRRDVANPIDLGPDAPYSIGVLALQGRAVRSLGIRVTVQSVSFGGSRPNAILDVPKVAFRVENTSWKPQIYVSLEGPLAPRSELLEEKVSRYLKERSRELRSWLMGPTPADSARQRLGFPVPVGSTAAKVLPQLVGLGARARLFGPRWVAIVVQLPWRRDTARIAFIVEAHPTRRARLRRREAQ
jgi:hypothetical protein